MNILYNKVKNKHYKAACIVTNNVIHYTNSLIVEFMMKFGKLQIFDSSVEKSLTRDIPIRLFKTIICYSNGQPRYYCRTSHPRIFEGPHSFLFCRVNNDT